MKYNAAARRRMEASRFYEDFHVLVPCKLVDTGKHEIVIRLHMNRRVVFQRLCDSKIADAAERLSKTVTCKLAMDLLRAEIQHGQALAVGLCVRCRIPVLTVDGFFHTCPFCRGSVQETPFWKRIVRDGRLQPRQQKRVVG